MYVAPRPPFFSGGLPPAPAPAPKGEKGEGKRKEEREREREREERKEKKNHSTQDSHVVPHHGTNWAALRLTAQIGRDAVLSESYGRGCWFPLPGTKCPSEPSPARAPAERPEAQEHKPALKSPENNGKKGVQPSKRSNKSLEQGLNLSGS